MEKYYWDPDEHWVCLCILKAVSDGLI